MALIKISFFKTKKHRVFNYTPRHYDPQKEELDERVRQSEREAGYVRERETSKTYVPNIKGQFKKNMSSIRQSKETSYNKKVKYIIVLSTVVVFFIMMYYMMQWLPYLFNFEQ